MNSLPYEILQYISSHLLPRYQCRFAMTSRYHYRYLYTPLLQWHVRKVPIQTPLWKYTREKYCTVSMLQFDKRLVLYVCYPDGKLHANNCTSRRITSISANNYEIYHMDAIRMFYLCMVTRDKHMLIGYYKYINKDLLRMYLDSRQPLAMLPVWIFEKIYRMLPQTDRQNLLRANMSLAGRYTFA